MNGGGHSTAQFTNATSVDTMQSLSAAAQSLESFTAGRAATASDPGAVTPVLRHHPGLHAAQPSVSFSLLTFDDKAVASRSLPALAQRWTAPPCNRLSILGASPQADHRPPEERGVDDLQGHI